MEALQRSHPEYLCPALGGVMMNPVTLSPCQHHMDEQAVVPTMLYGNSRCPTCVERFSRTDPDPTLASRIGGYLETLRSTQTEPTLTDEECRNQLNRNVTIYTRRLKIEMIKGQCQDIASMCEYNLVIIVVMIFMVTFTHFLTD